MIIISNVIAFLLISYIANSFLSSKYSKNKYLAILFIFITLESFINHTGASPFKGIFLLIMYFLYVFIQFEGKPIQKILIIVPFFLIQVISEILVATAEPIIATNSGRHSGSTESTRLFKEQSLR